MPLQISPPGTRSPAWPRSDTTAAAAVSALGAKVRRGDLEDLEGPMEAGRSQAGDPADLAG
jgi:hypothetical protein